MMKFPTTRELVPAIGIAILVPLVFVTNHVNSFFPFVDPAPTLLFYSMQVGFSLFCLLVLFMFFRRADKAAFALILTLSLYYFFSSFHDTLKSISRNGFISQYRFLLPAIAVSFAVAFQLIKSSSRPFSRFNNYILFVLGIYILIDAGKLLYRGLDPAHAGSVKPEAGRIQLQKNGIHKRPDIFLIIVDEYASSKSLREQFDFDNTAMDSFFVHQGFDVLKYSKSNYNRTHFSIGSMLSLSYIETPHPFSLNNEDYVGAKNLMKYNTVMEFFHENGYEIRNHSGFDFKGAESPRPFDIVTTIVPTMKSHTMFNKINADLGWQLREGKVDTTYIHYLVENIDSLHNELFCRLNEEADRKSAVPRFVFSHLYLAHSPFMMDGSRKRRTMEIYGDSEENQVQSYLNNLPYVNQQIRQLVMKIRKGTNGNAIIIVMGDHGFRSWHPRQEMSSYFENFCAVYRPSPKDSISPGMTSVNLFRDLLNKEFGQKLPLLNDSLFFLIDSP